MAGGLAFAGGDVYGLLQDLHNGRHYPWRAHGATLPQADLELTAPATGTALEPVTLTGRLLWPSGMKPRGEPLVVTRHLPDGTSRTLAGAATAADGTFTVADRPPVSGAIRYDVLWDGNADFRWATKPATVTVSRRGSSLTLTGPAKGLAGRELKLAGRLDTAGQAPAQGVPLTVRRTVTNRGGTVTTTLPPVLPAADGAFTVADTPPVGGDHAYEVAWAGDDTFLPARAVHQIRVYGPQE
ncbi:hypothetical protein [Nonomuraea zeae]|uniref:Uncharacterized protein n=1 Tax=Nonomuraea zeae TaxID=1642303 RepID=A0A5S4G638_9ACTN|nr:hypothetical protein [Nonomuraea zeae]TMR21450.1 hypothetical protein ETD85_50895 [Nonomuraea zeae]